MELEKMVGLLEPNSPKENDNLRDDGLILLGFIQIYDPVYEVSDATNDGIPNLTATLNQV